MEKTAENTQRPDIFCLKRDRMSQENIHPFSNRFFILPDLHPIIDGHLLLVPKAHFSSFSNVRADHESKKEADYLTELIKEFLIKTFNKPVVIFEHGGIAQTVPHAHLHFLPTDLSILDDISQVAVPTTFSPNSSYLFYEEKNQPQYFSPIAKIPVGFLQDRFISKRDKAPSQPDFEQYKDGWQQFISLNKYD